MAALAGDGFETTGLARSVGAVHLFFAGVTNVASGALLVWLSVSGRLLPAAIDGIGRYVSPATALRYGGLLGAAATDGALVVGAVLLCLGFLACVVSWRSVRRQRSWRRGLAVAVCNGVNPLALPPSFVAATLLVVVRSEFAGRGVDAALGEDTREERTADRSEDADYGG